MMQEPLKVGRLAPAWAAIPPPSYGGTESVVCQLAGLQARAFLPEGDWDTVGAQQWRGRSARLKAAFNLAFWMPEQQALAVALDGANRQVDAAPNMGHCLWTGIVDDDKAAAVAAHLAEPALNSGFGVRTLPANMNAYNPMSYHNGAVWPHDTAIVVAVQANYGFFEETQQDALGLLDAAAYFGGRLPQLFCGFSRADFAVPVPCPTSCSPQPWVTESSRLLLRSLLRFEPDIPHGHVLLRPMVPDRLLPLPLHNVPLCDLPAGVRLITAQPRHSH